MAAKKKKPTGGIRVGDARYHQLLLAKKKKLEALKFLQKYQRGNKLEYFNSGRALVDGKILRANPKQQLILDAWNNPLLKTFIYVGGNRCVGGETPIYDPKTGKTTPISEIKKDFNVLAWNGTELVPAFAFKPFAKEAEDLYRVTLETGQSFVAAGGHRVLTSSGYCAISELRGECVLVPPVSSLESYQSTRVLNVPRCTQTVPGSPGGCPAYYGFYGGQLPPGSDTDPAPAPSQDGAQTDRQCVFGYSDGRGSTRRHNHPYQYGDRLSIRGDLGRSGDHCVECEFYAFCTASLSSDSRNLTGQLPTDGCEVLIPPRSGSCRSANPEVASDLCGSLYTDGILSACDNQFSSLPSDSCSREFQPCSESPRYVHVGAMRSPFLSSAFVSAKVTYERTDVKWTTHVPVYNNYWAEGVVHRQSGKTTLGVIISLSVMFGEWIWNKQPIWFPHKDPRKVRLVSQDWESGVKKVVVPEIRKWWPEICPHESRKNSVGAEAFWVDKNTGSTLEIMTGNQDPMLHEGGHHDLIWFDEPISRDHYIANARGLVDRQGREFFSMTLLTNPWIDQEIIKKTLKDDEGRDTGKPDPSVFVVETTTTDNVGFGLTAKGLAEFRSKLTQDEIDVRIHGIPRYKKGLVYPMFKRDVHLKSRFKIPLDWMVDIAIDTHPRKPHSVLFLATNPYNLKYVAVELRMHGSGKQLADEIVRIVNWGKYRVNKVIIDPLSKGDSNDPTGSTYDQIDETLGRYGMYLETASKNKDTGVLKVKEHLMSENGEASLFFFEDLIYTIREIEGLMWEKPADEDKEKVQKTEDDMCECLYRLILLDTEYFPPVDNDLQLDTGRDSINTTTGY